MGHEIRYIVIVNAHLYCFILFQAIHWNSPAKFNITNTFVNYFRNIHEIFIHMNVTKYRTTYIECKSDMKAHQQVPISTTSITSLKSNIENRSAGSKYQRKILIGPRVITNIQSMKDKHQDPM